MKNAMFLKAIISGIIRPHGRYAFLLKLKKNAAILDAGCGNNSPFIMKSIRPDIVYTGIDIGDYNQVKPNLADEYITTSSEQFTATIEDLKNTFDAVISSHNLEHCDDREKTLTAMIHALKSGCGLYLSCPCGASVNFPQRKGTLNYYSDPTHKGQPPDYQRTIQILQENNMEIIFAREHCRPPLFYLIGLLLEPLSKAMNKALCGTWEYYGFETVIWARKYELDL
jgi:SAM-dependent methyltransferase